MKKAANTRAMKKYKQMVAASITMSDEQWHHCVQIRKQRKLEEERRR